MTGAEFDVRLAELLVASRELETSCAGTAKVYQRASAGTLVSATLPLSPATDPVRRLPFDSFIVASAPCLVVAQRLRYSCKECKVPLENDVRPHASPAAYQRLHHHGPGSIYEPCGRPAFGAAVSTVLEHTLVVDMLLAVAA